MTSPGWDLGTEGAWLGVAAWVIGLLLTYGVAGNLAVYGLVHRWPDWFAWPHRFWRLVGTQAVAGLLVTVLLAAAIRLDWVLMGLHLHEWRLSMRLLLLGGVPLSLLAAGIILVAPVRWLAGFNWGGTDRAGLAGRYLIGGVLGPVGEELFFRGLMQTVLLSLLGGGVTVGPVFFQAATLVVGLVFVLVHAANVLVKVESAAQFLLGLPERVLVALLIGYAFQETRSLLAPVLIHCLYNTLSFAAFTYRQNRPDWPR